MSSAPMCSPTTGPRASMACCGRATAISPPRSAPEAGRRSRRWFSSTETYEAKESDMTAQAGVEGAFRQQVVDVMTTVLARLLDRTDPITEDMRLMEELGMSSTLGLELLLELEDQLEILIDVEQLGDKQMSTV